jgi:hypothetical protein
MPRNYIDLSQPDGIARLIEAPGIANPVRRIIRKRGTAPGEEVQFIEDGEPTNPGDITLTFMVKQVGQYDGEPLVSASGDDWTTPGDVSGFYTGAPSYNTTELNTDMRSPDGDPTNDVASKVYMGAYSFRIGEGEPIETEEFEVLVVNKVINGNESIPVPALAAQAYTSTAFISGAGNDATAVLGNPFKPYLTTQAAWDDGAKVMVLFPNPPFGYSGFTSSVEVNLTLIGFGWEISTIGTIESPMGGTITGNGPDMVSITQISSTPNTVPVGSAENAGSLTVRGCRIIAIVALGGTGVDALANGGDGGTVTLTNCVVTSSIEMDGGDPGSGGIPGAAGTLVATRSTLTLDHAGTFRDCLVAGLFRSLLETTPFVAVPYASTITLACSAYTPIQKHKVTLTGDAVLAMAEELDGMSGIFLVTQGGLGDHNITLPAGSVVDGTVTTSIALTALGGTIDILRWIYDGTHYFWFKESNAN